MDDPEFEELTEKTRKDCYEKVKLINEKMPKIKGIYTEQDVDNVFNYVDNYYLFSTPNLVKHEYKFFLMKLEGRVLDFFERTYKSDFINMTPRGILEKIFGKDQVNEVMEKMNKYEEETRAFMQNNPLEELDGGSRIRRRKSRKTNKKSKKHILLNLKKSKKSKKSKKNKK